MNVQFLEVLCEEPSAEIALRALLEKLLAGTGVGFEIYPFRDKQDLLRKLPQRLQGYSRWLPEDHRIVVLVDRDQDDCLELRAQLEATVLAADLSVHSLRDSVSGQVLPRILVEELEAWFFGDVDALMQAFPRMPGSLAERRGYRDPDGIPNTWEALERVLQNKGYFASGYRKREAARLISKHMDPARNRSRSFRVFRDGVLDLVR